MNSLRRDIHSALEVITPPLGGMPERMVQTVLAEKSGRLRKERMVFRLRVSLALVAAVLIAGVGVAAVMTWNSLSNFSPAGHSGSPPLLQLESRPLQLPRLASVAQCNPGPISALGYGAGPIHVVGGGSNSFSVWGTYFHSLAYSDASLKGPVLVRAIDLVKGGRFVFIGPGAAGAIVGTDTVEGELMQQHAEVVIDTSQTSADLGPWFNSRTRDRFDWPFITGLPASWSGAAGWQFDGPGFSEYYVMCP